MWYTTHLSLSNFFNKNFCHLIGPVAKWFCYFWTENFKLIVDLADNTEYP